MDRRDKVNTTDSNSSFESGARRQRPSLKKAVLELRSNPITDFCSHRNILACPNPRVRSNPLYIYLTFQNPTFHVTWIQKRFYFHTI
jgi:hypothetical protein